jgi:uncharacterized membrane protein YkvA (DUF1232 family)
MGQSFSLLHAAVKWVGRILDRKNRGPDIRFLPTLQRVGLARTSMIDRLKNWARGIKRDVHALYLASRDPHVPWYAKVLGVAVAAYALSPIDLIPDFIPVLGYLDDLIIVPAGIFLVVRLIPREIMAQHRAAAAVASERPGSRRAATVIVAIWVACTLLAGWLVYRWFALDGTHNLR